MFMKYEIVATPTYIIWLSLLSYIIFKKSIIATISKFMSYKIGQLYHLVCCGVYNPVLLNLYNLCLSVLRACIFHLQYLLTNFKNLSNTYMSMWESYYYNYMLYLIFQLWPVAVKHKTT